jgi:uncharacterized protein with FMN-binding domain
MIRKILIVTFIAVGVFIIVGIAMMMKMRPVLQEQKQVRRMEISNADLTKVLDGVYQGDFTYGGFTFLVEVGVTNHKIENIKILKNMETSHAKHVEGVIERIIQKQSPNVDAITGATTTSKALMKAVENALTKGVQK